jgi:hypothetical protein
MRVIVRSALLLVQISIAAFYVWFAMRVWAPFMAGPVEAKLFVCAIIACPILGLLVASRGTGFLRLAATPALALLTIAQVATVILMARSVSG